MEPEPPEGEEIDPEELKKRIEAADPSEPRLKPISQDCPVKGGADAWIVRMYGDETDFKQLNPALPSVNYGVAVAKSLWWPGSYSFFTQGRYCSIYVGNGLKYEEASYYPVFPPKITADPKERPTAEEPNPANVANAEEGKPPEEG